jgi:hypothetical protein
MIDASKSPVPAWKRYATLALMSVLVVVAGYVIYTKEIHKSSSSPSTAPAPATAHPQTSPSTTPSVSTTIPGGIPISNRNPFQ